MPLKFSEHGKTGRQGVKVKTFLYCSRPRKYIFYLQIALTAPDIFFLHFFHLKDYIKMLKDKTYYCVIDESCCGLFR